MEMDEFPFNLMRLRKKDNLDCDRGFSCFQSSFKLAEEAEGSRFSKRWTKAILVERLSLLYVDQDFSRWMLEGLKVGHQRVSTVVGK